MITWEDQIFELFNQSPWRIVAAGTLQVPIRRFTVHRNKALHLAIETEIEGQTNAAVDEPADGMPRLRTAQVKLDRVGGAEGLLDGVVATSQTILQHSPLVRKEEAEARQLTFSTGHCGKAAYTIEWLENVRSSPLLWPDSVATTIKTTTTRRMATGVDGIELSQSHDSGGFSQAAAKLVVAGQTLYLCALEREMPAIGIKPGCIVYLGAPDGGHQTTNFARRSVLRCLSLSAFT